MKALLAVEEGETRSLLSNANDSKAGDAEDDAGAVMPYYSSLFGGDNDGVVTSPGDGNVVHQGDAKEADPPLASRTSSHMNAFIALSCAIATSIIAIYRHYSFVVLPQPLLQLSDEKEQSTKKPQSFFEGAYSTITNEPLSYKSPEELGVPVYNDRPEYSRPESVFGTVQNGSQVGVPLPTNEWYLNLVVGLDDSPGPNHQYENFAGVENRVYTIPYIVDTVGPIVGIRLHYPYVLSYGTVVQSDFIPLHGLTLGTADAGFTRRYQVDEDTLPNKLGVGLRWEKQHQRQSHHYMRSRVLRGMPYGTMEYAEGVMPTVASEVVPTAPLIDGSMQLQCGTLDPSSKGHIITNSTSALVKKEVELTFWQSDLTWLVFFSRPVKVQCWTNPNKVMGTVSLPPGAEPPNANPNAFQLRVISADDLDESSEEPLIVRIALANNCTSGTNVHFCNENSARDQSSFKSVLREHADVYPTSPTVKYAFTDPKGGLAPDRPDSKSAYLFFDWAAKSFSRDSSNELIMFALPHHVDILRGMDGQSSNEFIDHCVHSLHGNACLIQGGIWAMEEELGGMPNFMAPRPPNHLAIPALAKALSKDIAYSLPDNYMLGAGDTYFSGKMLAKLGRIIVVAQELRGLAATPDSDIPDTSTADGEKLMNIIHACKEASLPSEEEITNAVDRLRRGVEVWLNGNSESMHTYDNTWGGLVNCGCWFNGDGCDNAYPNCPSYSDPGLNFGNGFYNDHHFHSGYHIYAAAILAEFDREWGKKYFEQVMLLIRDIANPSEKDIYFPIFRQKDWFLGNSWASGIALYGGRPYLNGRNQESSSEAIAAYEGIAMYGSVMMKAFGNGKSSSEADNQNAYTACHIFNIGRFLATTEIRSADRYWHVYFPKRDPIYPDSYRPAVVSMMWDTMCQFQTWFGNAPYLAYGIQLLPLTPVSERRDSDQWIRQLHSSFSESCNSDANCVNEGWSVLLYAVLAELGHADMAMEKALALPEDVFESAGGSGHSLTNTLWYIASRPTPTTPFDLSNPSKSIDSKAVPPSEKEKKIDCGCPDTCTSEALGSNVDGFTCMDRIQWLMQNKGFSELGACKQVAGNEYSNQCGACNPGLCAPTTDTAQEVVEEYPPSSSGCPPCSADVCKSDINRCQIVTAPYLCYEGGARGGCSSIPWETNGPGCSACCELFKGCEG